MIMTTLFAAAALALLAAILWSVWKMVRAPLPPDLQQKLEEKERLKMEALEQKISGRVGETVRLVLEQMQGQVRTTEQSVSQKLQQANDTFANVSREIGRLQEATRKVEEVGRSVATLEDLLRSPKMRGGFGEFFLADLLTQILPSDFFGLQHEFSDGEKVDAVIRLQERLVPVDSKFPLEQFRRMGSAVTDEERAQWKKQLVRDVKVHIDSIAQKYIRPAEGTYDFALMYIPAENVYYETIIRDDGVSDEKGIFRHALRRQVIPVSPNSFYAYLMVILQGLRGFAVEQRAREILGSLMRLQKELSGVREDFNRAGKQLSFAVDNFEKADKHLSRFEDRLISVESVPAQGADPERLSAAGKAEEEEGVG